MWNIPRLTIVTIALAAASIGVAHAHHGWSSYDSAKEFTIEGTIKTASYGYPHASMVMEHEGKDWTIVLAPPSRMESRGAKPDAIVEGKSIAATGYPKTDGEPEMRAEYVTIDGKQVQLR
jgi:hypothetical protein